jgi:hypothetical protein
LNEEEDNAFDRGEISMTKEESWDRLFDFEILTKNTYWNTSPLFLQGVTGKIDISQVKKVRSFVARGMNY